MRFVETMAPIRTCVGCGTRDRQAVLTRLQVDESGALVPVARARAGRSAYVHATAECARALLKTRFLGRSLRGDVDRSARAATVERLGVPLGDPNELARPRKRP